MQSIGLGYRYLVILLRVSVVLLLCGLFVSVALAAGLNDASVDDFSLGAGCAVSQSDTGQTAGTVILTPTVGTIFSGASLASDWFSQTGSVLSAGNLLINEGRAGTNAPPLYSPNRTLEFVATFRNAGNQDAGLGLDLSSAPYAIFSTGNTGDQLYARTDNGLDPELSAPLGTSYFNAPHQYRIDWQTTGVTYWIDDQPVATHTLEFTAAMHPIAEEFNTTEISLALNWLRMSDYAPATCTFTSRVINSGADGTSWTNFTTTVLQPAGTSIAFEIHTSTDNVTWSDWQPVTSTTINLNGRYVQYRAALTTTNPLVTPQLLSASFGGSPLAVELKDLAAAPTASPLSSELIIASLMLASLWLVILWRICMRKEST